MTIRWARERLSETGWSTAYDPSFAKGLNKLAQRAACEAFDHCGHLTQRGDRAAQRPAGGPRQDRDFAIDRCSVLLAALAYASKRGLGRRGASLAPWSAVGRERRRSAGVPARRPRANNAAPMVSASSARLGTHPGREQHLGAPARGLGAAHPAGRSARTPPPRTRISRGCPGRAGHRAPCQRSALRIPLSHCRCPHHLCNFGLQAALPLSPAGRDSGHYYGHSVTASRTGR